MNVKSKNIDRVFKNKLGNYEDIPGTMVWEKISEKLGHKKKRTLVIFMSRVAAGIALIVALGLGYYFLNKDSSEKLAESAEQATEKTITSPDKLAEPEVEKIPESEIITSREKTYGPGLSKSIKRDQPEETDIYISGDILSRIKSISVNTIENTYVENIKIAPGVETRPAQESLKPTEYIAEEKIIYEDAGSEENKWTIGGELAPLYSYRNVTSDYLDSYVKDQINSKESGIITYTVGLNFAMSPGKRFSISSGIYYSKYGQQTDAVNIYTSNVPAAAWDNTPEENPTNILISQSYGTVISNNADLLKFNQSLNANEDNSKEIRYFSSQTIADKDVDAKATQYFEYLEIPLIIKYKIIDRKMDFNILTGISTHFLIGNDIYLDYTNLYDNDRFPENVNVNNMNYSGSLGIGIEYPVLSKLMLNIEPRFKYYINPIVSNPSYNIHPYSFGIFTGISYVF
jgi:hypothetical protein